MGGHSASMAGWLDGWMAEWLGGWPLGCWDAGMLGYDGYDGYEYGMGFRVIGVPSQPN